MWSSLSVHEQLQRIVARDPKLKLCKAPGKAAGQLCPKLVRLIPRLSPTSTLEHKSKLPTYLSILHSLESISFTSKVAIELLIVSLSKSE
jgi:hypothetical protein